MSKHPNGVEQQQMREFAVRMPIRDPSRKLTILKFNGSLNVKPENWSQGPVQMEREDNRRQGVTSAGELIQDYGEGSIYGKAARDEARRKKFGRQSRKYEHDKQPWKLTIEKDEKEGPDLKKTEEGTTTETKAAKKTRKFRSIREAGASEHADYWIFYRVGNVLEAYKVDEWYQFLPAVTYKFLDAEQAEERFLQQDKVFNQFALKAQIQKQLAEQEEREQQDQLKAKTSGLKIKDEASSDDEDEGEEAVDKGGDGNGGKGRKKLGKAPVNKKLNKKEKQRQNREKKKQRVEAGDEVAAYESEDGEDEGREYDYMSDSGSDTDREELNADQKMDEDLVGVAEERGLKNALESDEEDEEGSEEEEEDQEEAKEAEEEAAKEQQKVKEGGGEKGAAGTGISRAKAVQNVDAMMAQRGGSKIAAEIFANKEESEGSDTDEDPDREAVKSVLFMQDKRTKSGQGTSSEMSRKRPAESIPTSSSADQMESEEAKRPKLEQVQVEDVINGEITESFIRRLLDRKPHSTKQLLTKSNQRLQQKLQQPAHEQGKDKRIVARLADILKKIEPYQFRRINEDTGKEVLYFSLNRTA